MAFTASGASCWIQCEMPGRTRKVRSDTYFSVPRVVRMLRATSASPQRKSVGIWMVGMLRPKKRRRPPPRNKRAIPVDHGGESAGAGSVERDRLRDLHRESERDCASSCGWVPRSRGPGGGQAELWQPGKLKEKHVPGLNSWTGRRSSRAKHAGCGRLRITRRSMGWLRSMAGSPIAPLLRVWGELMARWVPNRAVFARLG